MATINTRDEVRSYYQQQTVAEGYIQKRFTEPLNVVEHGRQVAFLNKVIREKQLQKIMEFAPGPARLTADLHLEGGTSIDASENMLTLARQRKKNWNFVQGDILNMKLKAKQDLVFCVRFLLHFQKEERKKIYGQAWKALDQGYLVFEAMNSRVVGPLRGILGKERYLVYDQLYTLEELQRELEENGFQLEHLEPILSHFWLQALCSRPLKWLGMRRAAAGLIRFLEQFPSSQPYEWMVLAQKVPRRP